MTKCHSPSLSGTVIEHSRQPAKVGGGVAVAWVVAPRIPIISFLLTKHLRILNVLFRLKYSADLTNLYYNKPNILSKVVLRSREVGFRHFNRNSCKCVYKYTRRNSNLSTGFLLNNLASYVFCTMMIPVPESSGSLSKDCTTPATHYI